MTIRLAETMDILERQQVDPDGRILGIAETARAIMTLDGAAARDVIAERRRQIEAEGWTPQHDDEHDFGEMARAAACYALSSRGSMSWARNLIPRLWPWENTQWNPKDPRRDLVRAAALILAEIERLDRLAPPAPEPQP
jgi:hypothetical protein